MNGKTFEQRCEETGVYLQPIPVPTLDKLGDALETVYCLVADAAGDCDCYESSPGTTAKCHACKLREAAATIQQALDVDHRSLHPERLSNHPERIYLEHWKKQQERSPGINRGYGLLENILSPLRQQDWKQPMWPGRPRYEYHPPISQRDAEVAASVIQWLGTNCGQSLILECERKIKSAQAVRSDFNSEQVNFHRKPVPEESRASILAHEIAHLAAESGTKRYEAVRIAALAAFRALGLHIAAAAAVEVGAT